MAVKHESRQSYPKRCVEAQSVRLNEFEWVVGLWIYVDARDLKPGTFIAERSTPGATKQIQKFQMSHADVSWTNASRRSDRVSASLVSHSQMTRIFQPMASRASSLLASRALLRSNFSNQNV